jgi:Histidine acid phosphatase.
MGNVIRRDELLQVQIVMRHGDRTPLETLISPNASLSPPPERKKEKKKGLTKRWNSGKKLELSSPHSVNP